MLALVGPASAPAASGRVVASATRAPQFHAVEGKRRPAAGARYRHAIGRRKPTPPSKGRRFSARNKAAARIFRRPARARRSPLASLRRATTLVVDLDNTVVDTRPRTLAAVLELARTRPELLSRRLRERAPSLSKWDVGYDAVETAERLGLERAAADELAEIWDRTFWDPASFDLDEPIRRMVNLLHDSRAKEIIFLSGRSDQLVKQTLEQLHRVGVPPAQLVLKPEGMDTPEFKAGVIAGLVSPGKRVVFIDDSSKNLAAVQRIVPEVTTIAVDFPVREASPEQLAPNTMSIRLGHTRERRRASSAQ